MMVPAWARDAALGRADLVGQALVGQALVVRDKDRDKDKDLPEVVRVDPAVLANGIAVRAFDIRRGTADD